MICPDLQQLLVCRDLLTDSLIQTLQSLQQSPESESLQSRLAAQLIEKAEQLGLSGNLLPAYLTYQLIWGDNTASRTLEQVRTAPASWRPWPRIWLYYCPGCASIHGNSPVVTFCLPMCRLSQSALMNGMI